MPGGHDGRLDSPNRKRSKPVNSFSLRVFSHSRSSLARRQKKSRSLAASAVLAVVLILSSSAFLNYPDIAWIDRTIENLSLRNKIAQLVLIRIPGTFMNQTSPEFQEIENQIRQNHVGGVVLFAGNVYESAVLLNKLQAISELPLLVAADFERGVSFRIADTTSFPWTMALGAAGSEQFAYEQGRITAEESRALGVHWIFAPVMDVNNNPDNPVINIRSFGEDPALVSRLGAAFIRGAKSGGVLTTAKHFPGHGDTTTDTHLALAVVQSDMTRLQSVEFAPFRSAIEAGVDSIMTAHIAVPLVTGETQVPATYSSVILTDVLRNTLKFDGIIVTDALEMSGVRNQYWGGKAAVRAIQAGADILLLPTNTTATINEVERAVKRGDIPEARIDQSVRKILQAKSTLNLHRNRAISIDQISKTIASPQHTDLAQEIADHSVTIAKDEKNLIPVNPLKNTRIFSLVLSPGLDSSPGSYFQAEMRRRFPSIRTAWGNARVPDELLSAFNRYVAESDLIVLATAAGYGSRRDALSVPGSQKRIIEALMASRKPIIWVALGNPYVLPLAPKIGTYICTFSGSDVSQIAAAKAIAGTIGTSGKMPISIPPYLKAGDGLQLPKLEMTLKPLPSEQQTASRERFEKTRQLVTALIDAGLFPGAQLLVARQNQIVLDMAAGAVGYSDGSAEVTSKTVYDIASLSNLVGTTSAAMLASESGSLISANRVKDYIPELQGTDIENLGIQSLLQAFSHSSRLSAESRNAREDALKEMVFRATGFPLDRLLATQLFDPLGLKHTFFNTPKDYEEYAAASGSSGSTPLFCNAGDLAVFTQILLNRGIYDHQRFFKSGTIATFTGPWGPWSRAKDFDWADGLFSSSAFGHFSTTGPFLWIDPAKEMFVIFLANGSSGDERIADAQRKIVQSAYGLN